MDPPLRIPGGGARRLWLDAGTDVLTTISPRGGTTLVEFDLTGRGTWADGK